jgi:hypothetical protein
MSLQEAQEQQQQQQQPTTSHDSAGNKRPSEEEEPDEHEVGCKNKQSSFARSRRVPTRAPKKDEEGSHSPSVSLVHIHRACPRSHNPHVHVQGLITLSSNNLLASLHAHLTLVQSPPRFASRRDNAGARRVPRTTRSTAAAAAAAAAAVAAAAAAAGILG